MSWLLIAFAFYSFIIAVAIVWAGIDAILKKIGLVKGKIESPFSYFKGKWSFLKIAAFLFGLICIYGTTWGFTETPGALFEKPEYTVFYEGYASLGKSPNSRNVIVQITHDNGYYIDNLFFIPEGKIKQVDGDWIKSPEELFDNLQIRDSISGLEDCYWHIELTNPAKQSKIDCLNYNRLTKEQWVEIVDNDTKVCFICGEIRDSEEGKYYDFNDSINKGAFICDYCQEKKGGFRVPIIPFRLNIYLLNPDYSVREMNEIIANYAYERYLNGEDYWNSVIENMQPLIEECVYWTPNGKSYHSTRDCVALLDSNVILSGTLDEAIAAGKTDPCSKCVFDGTDWQAVEERVRQRDEEMRRQQTEDFAKVKPYQ